MGEEDTITGQMSKYLRLLVVNDPSYQPEEWYAALRKRFLVTVVESIEETVKSLREIKVPCVVAFVGGNVAARAVSEALEASHRIVYVRRDDVTPDDDLFMLTSGKTWLPTTATVEELIDRVTSL
jgi:succinyl-CoA synthetase alpha subunit